MKPILSVSLLVLFALGANFLAPREFSGEVSAKNLHFHFGRNSDAVTPPKSNEVVRLIRVVDGDTIFVQRRSQRGPTKVRLAMIDAPESKQAFGPEATDHLKALLKGKKLELIPQGTDKYGRTLGVLVDYYGNDCFNLMMVTDGYAWDYEEKAGPYATAEAEARTHARGLWDTKVKPVPPWEFRKEKHVSIVEPLNIPM